jgi:NTE family protein
MTKPKKLQKRRQRAAADRYTERLPIATCLGSGGSYGIAFNLGVVMGLADAGIDVLPGPIIGASAGSYSAAALRTGIDFDLVMEAWPKEFKLRVSRAIQVTGPLFGDKRVDDAGAVALRLWSFRREILWGDEADLADIVAASSSPPPFALPHKVRGHRYIDGGYGSPTSVDLAPVADLLVVVTPIWKAAGRMGKSAVRKLDREVADYRSLGGGRVLHVAPDDRIDALEAYKVPNIFNADLARQVFPLAREVGRQAAKDAG